MLCRSKYLGQGVAALQSKPPETHEQIYLYMVCSLFTVPFSGYEAWRQNCFRMVLAFANLHCKDASVPQYCIQNLFATQKPLLIFLAIVQFVFENVHQRVQRPELAQGIE